MIRRLDENLINRAYVYATAKHGSQKRHSGDPYFAHPIEVAGILTEYKLDAATIVAGLLHDTIEDTEATREEIAKDVRRADRAIWSKASPSSRNSRFRSQKRTSRRRTCRNSSSPCRAMCAC